MKKLCIIVLCSCLMMLFVGCSSKLSTYTTISLDEVYEKLGQKDSFILTIGSASCSHCASFKPKMETVIKLHQVEVFYIDVSKLSEDDYKEFIQRMNFTGTPTTIFFEDGKETAMSNRIEGDKDIEVIEAKMRKMGYIE